MSPEFVRGISGDPDRRKVLGGTGRRSGAESGGFSTSRAGRGGTAVGPDGDDRSRVAQLGLVVAGTCLCDQGIDVGFAQAVRAVHRVDRGRKGDRAAKGTTLHGNTLLDVL